MNVLVIGASGYIGSYLVPLLAERGHRVRAAARNVDALTARGWAGVECIAADVLHADTLDVALTGVEVAYYLVHSMGSGKAFPQLDRTAARNFRRAAERAGVQHIVFLGGLLQPKPQPQPAG